MQALCQWDVQGDASSATLAAFLDALEATGAAVVYATQLFEGLQAKRAVVDGHITAATGGKWDLSRISPIERNIIRVAVVEFLADEVPTKVVINEAIEIARAFGGEDSPRFVNGVLDEIHRGLASQATPGDVKE